jgi:hypothetical protein
MSHWTTHDWRKYGVRKCQVLGDSGKDYRTVVSGLPVTIPKIHVFATAAMAHDAACDEQRRLVKQQMAFWTRFADRPIEVES